MANSESSTTDAEVPDVIIHAHGDLLASDVDALVNTVNCVGVMGKGIALQFKRRYPQMFKSYAAACGNGEVQIGRMFVVSTEALDGPRYVINFPTKKHWRSPSKIEYVEAGMDDLRRVIKALDLRSVAIPPLGAGNGGLDWAQVEPLITDRLGDIPGVDIHLFAPVAGHREVEPVQGVRLTWGRAMMLQLLINYVDQRQQAEPWEDPQGASHLEIQKLMYFANYLQPDLKLDFVQGRYGPYSERVRHLIQGMEGSFLTRFGDGDDKALALEPIAPTPEARRQLDEFVLPANHSDSTKVIERVGAITEGFEGPYGIELLASTHWVAAHQGAVQPDRAAEAVRSWSQRKGRIFTDHHVEVALAHLRESGALDEHDLVS